LGFCFVIVAVVKGFLFCVVVLGSIRIVL